MPADANKRTRWMREENIERYCRLLTTPLTDLERQFVERRLAEEREVVAEHAASEEMSVHSNAA